MAPPPDTPDGDLTADEQASDGDDAAALRDRVDALEQTVSEQQATIEALSSPTASRRGVLAALTGVAGAGALGAYSQRASAQAAGQVGTQSEPVDVEAYDLTVQNQLAADLDAGGNSLTNVAAVETDQLGSAGGLTTTDITNLEGPGLQVNPSNELESDLQLPQDVGSSRSLDVWETNNTGNPLVVSISVDVPSPFVTDGDNVIIEGHVNSSQTNQGIVDDFAASTGSFVSLGLQFVVPAGAEYKVATVVDDTTGLAIASGNWFEYQWGA